MICLGIETSCDETAVGIVQDGRDVLGHAIASSVDFHKQYGGVVPEIACRHHVELITYCVENALTQAGCKLSDVGAVAVTYGPGLVGALLIGMSAAKSLSWALDRPLVGVNHLHAHLYAARLGAEAWPERAVGLVVSGGHTVLSELKGLTEYHTLGQTHDDAVGEAFDKVAKLLGLGFPGGPAVEEAAKKGNPSKIRFSKSVLKHANPWDFSFSGIKTAVRRVVERAQASGEMDAQFVSDVSASFQKTVVDELAEKAMLACEESRAQALVVGGGVIANQSLRARLQEICQGEGLKLHLPGKGLSTDNGAMVAGLGYQLREVCQINSPLSLAAEPQLGMR